MPAPVRRLAGVVLAATMLVTACSGGREDDPVIEGLRSTTTSTSTTSTTVAPTTTTSTTAPPVAITDPRVKVVVSPGGIVLPVIEHVDGGLRVNTPCGRTVVVASGTPVTEATVVLDPGHGGVEFGAADPKGQGFTEKVVNLAVTKFTEEALRKAGVSVVLTRTADYRMTLGARAKVATTLQPAAFVSIHHNGESDGPRAGPGSEMFYQVASPTSASSRRLAGLIYEEIVKTLSQYPGIPWEADRDAGVKYRRSASGDDYYGMLRLTKGVTAVLAELAFHSNPAERDLLTRPEVQRAEGEAVARGILRFLTTQDPGSGFVEPYPRDSPAGGGGGGAGCVDPPL